MIVNAGSVKRGQGGIAVVRLAEDEVRAAPRELDRLHAARAERGHGRLDLRRRTFLREGGHGPGSSARTRMANQRFVILFLPEVIYSSGGGAMKRYAGVLILSLMAVAAGVLLGAQAPEAAPDWAYGYLAPVEPGDKVAPPCPERPKAFPDCAYVARRSPRTA